MGKRSTRMRPATEQTPEIPADARSTPTRPATKQTPEIPADAEATMAWLSTIDDVTLIFIFEHFANCYVAMQTYLHYLDEEATAIGISMATAIGIGITLAFYSNASYYRANARNTI